MREMERTRTYFNRTVGDGGWEMPVEFLQEVIFRIVETRTAAMKRVTEQKEKHIGEHVLHE